MKRPSRSGTGLLFTLFIACLFFPILSRAGGWVAAWGDNGFGQSGPPSGLNGVKAIATGGFHNLALKTDGMVVAWGYNEYGQANMPVGLTGIRNIGCGYFHSLVVKSDGSVAAWGFNSDGQTNVPADLSAVTAVAAGYFHSLALKADGHVVAWGANGDGESSVPAGLSNVTAIAASELNSAALTAEGRVVAWGDNTYNQTNVPPDVTNVIAIAAGERHFVALKADGTVAAWGFNQHGEIDLPTGLSNIVAIATGSFHTLALRADGTLISWGYGESSVTIIPSVVTNVTAIAAGAVHNLVIVGNQLLSPVGKIEITVPPQDQSVLVGSKVTFSIGAASTEGPLNYQWLFNGSPLSDNARVSGSASATLSITTLQLGDAGNYSVIVSNVFDSVTATAALTVLSPPFITSQPVDRTVRAGSDVTFSASAGGTAPLRYQWNFNGTEIPGATSTTLALTNVQPGQSGLYHLCVTNLYGTALTVRASLTVTDSPPYFLRSPSNQVAGIGSSATFSVIARGSEQLNYQWRFNGVDIPSATNATLQLNQLRYDQTGYYSVEVGNAFGSTNSIKALLNVSQVLVTGSSVSLGVGALVNFGTNIPTGLSNVTAVAAGASYVMALKSDGLVRTWLEPAAGIVGSPQGVTNIPVSVTNVMAIAAGYDHCLALRSNGTVIAWGGNSGGQTAVPQGLTNVVAIAAGQNRSYAVKSDGSVTGWGSQQLPSGLSNIVTMVAGSAQNVALRRDGSVVTWPASSGTFTVVPALSNVIAVATSSSGNMALRQDGTVWKWFSSGGVQPIFNGNFPLSNIVAIAAGLDLDMLLRADGVLLPGPVKRFSFTITNNIMAIAAGGVQSPFGVTVIGNGAPQITLQPVSQIVPKSSTVQLHARTVGVQPMRYQWLLDNQPLPNATNASLVVSNFVGKNSGGYQMIASNALGTVASQVAAITIPFNTNLPAALNATNLQWTTPVERNAAWFAQPRDTHDGDVAAQSGATTNGGSSTLQVYLPNPGTISFWWKTSSEEGYDFLRVYVDQSTTPLFGISGETDWEQKSITFPTGGHTVRWIYAKDVSVSAGRDAGFLDEVKFTVPPPVVTITPATQTVNANANASFFATTLSYDKPITYQWLLNGTNLAGATNQTLSLPGCGRKDQGGYSVRVTNSGGSVLVSNATLRVIVHQRLSDLRRLADGSVELLSRDSTGGAIAAGDLAKFEAQASTNLVNWQVLPEALSVTNGSLLLHDPAAGQWPQRFYRVVEH